MSNICEVCVLPKEICVCEDIAREQQQITIAVYKRRYGKMMTIVDGINPHDLDIDALITKLKKKCASARPSEIEKFLRAEQNSRIPANKRKLWSATAFSRAENRIAGNLSKRADKLCHQRGFCRRCLVENIEAYYEVRLSQKKPARRETKRAYQSYGDYRGRIYRRFGVERLLSIQQRGSGKIYPIDDNTH